MTLRAKASRSPRRAIPAAQASRLAVFGQRLRGRRLALGLTLEEAAERMRVDAKYLQQLETGRVNVSLLTMHRCADGLGIAIGSLFASQGAEQAPVVRVEQPAYAPQVDADQALRMLGEAIAAQRLRRGITQAALASSVGLSLSTVRQAEAGRQNITVTTLALIASALDVPVWRLLAESAGEVGLHGGRRKPRIRGPVNPRASPRGRS